MLPLVAGDRDQELASTSGGVEQGWVRIHSAHRPSQAPRTVAKQLRTQSEQEVHAFKKRCGTACACEAEAPQALATLAPG